MLRVLCAWQRMAKGAFVSDSDCQDWIQQNGAGV